MRIFVSRKEIDRSFHFAYSLEIGIGETEQQ